jgi:hypothetical protein
MKRIAFAAVCLATVAAFQTTASSAEKVATIGAITTKDFRVAVVATRLAGAPPTADVRVGMARRVGSSWRELGERRLPGTYFWHTMSGPRPVCRLQVTTAGRGGSFRPFVVVQLLQSPSLGCGRAYRFPLVAR